MKHLPIDVSTFQIMMNHDYVYIDKTEQIYNLFNKGIRYYFLSRPRRFGKTLLISTLKDFFSGNKNLFKTLWIEKETNYEWPIHPVIHLDFSTLDSETEVTFKDSLIWELSRIANLYDLDISSAPTLNSKLKMLITTLSKKNQVVILIDEYDYPLLRNLSDPKKAKSIQKLMSGFFAAIKGTDAHLRAIFITGVTKFSKTSIFSGMNNLNDISLKPEAATLLGYTEKELHDYLKPYLIEFSKSLHCTFEEITHKMRNWYNGYRFTDLNHDYKVYNPYSVLYSLHDKKFQNYWFETGTPSFLIHLIKMEPSVLQNIENVELSADSLGAFEIDSLPLIPILFQTGYLTIHDYNKELSKFRFSYPNQEVRISFNKHLLSAFTNSNAIIVEESISHIRQALDSNDVNLFCETIKALFANIPYPLHIPSEKYYHSLFQFMLDLLGFDVQSEIMTNKGRIDLIITIPNRIFLFEIKFNHSGQTALKQIRNRHYYEKYLLHNKPLTLIGLSFNYQNKNLQMDWVSEEC